MGGGFGYTNQRKMKETKSSPSMGESMNIVTLKCSVNEFLLWELLELIRILVENSSHAHFQR